MIHGELLTAIEDEVRSEPDPDIVISEIDCIPHTNFLSTVHFLLGNFALAMPEYITRNDALQVVRYNRLFSGPWFIARNRRLADPDLPLDWLSSGGPNNDAANLSVAAFIASAPFAPVALLAGEGDLSDLGMNYRQLLYHAFWCRHWLDDPARDLLPGFTLATHLENINARLLAVE